MSTKNSSLYVKANGTPTLNRNSPIANSDLTYGDLCKMSKAEFRTFVGSSRSYSCTPGNYFEMTIKDDNGLPANRAKSGMPDLWHTNGHNIEIKSGASPLCSLRMAGLVIYCPIINPVFNKRGYFDMTKQECWVMPKKTFIKILHEAKLMKDGDSHIQTFYVWKSNSLNCGGKYAKMVELFKTTKGVMTYAEWKETL